MYTNLWRFATNRCILSYYRTTSCVIDSGLVTWAEIRYNVGVEKTSSEPWIDLPENRAAWQAMDRVVRCVLRRGPRRSVNPLFLHGPPGVGKSRLVTEGITRLLQHDPQARVTRLSAAELGNADELPQPRQLDLLVIEDVQKTRGIETLVHLLDQCVARQRQLIVTSTLGPGQLPLPLRLTSRLAQGLVIALEWLSPASRRQVLLSRGPLPQEIVEFLVQSLPGSVRQLEGALTRVATLTETLGRSPTVEDLAELFQPDRQARLPSLERIARLVGRHYHIALEELRSQRRSREVLIPRQVGMYLARQLTPLSLEQIGAYFGGRDHTTVLHACRKVEEALTQDASLSGALRALQAELA